METGAGLTFGDLLRSHRDNAGLTQEDTFRADHDHATNASRAALGEEAFAAAWAEGRAVYFEEAITHALGDDA